jgi:Ca2+-binding EF-hand superfamily protein
VTSTNYCFFKRMEVDEEMDEEELAEWRTIFNLFDVDGDESITGEVKVHHLKIIPIGIISYLTLHSYRCSDMVNRISVNETAT